MIQADTHGGLPVSTLRVCEPLMDGTASTTLQMRKSRSSEAKLFAKDDTVCTEWIQNGMQA